jgi:hypothetical protein
MGTISPSKSGSVPLDSRGGYSTESLQAHGAEKHPGFKHGEKTFNPREPRALEIMRMELAAA